MADVNPELKIVLNRAAAAFRSELAKRSASELTAYGRARSKAEADTGPAPSEATRTRHFRVVLLSVLTLALVVLWMAQCRPADPSVPPAADDGLLDCDEPSAVLLDVEWVPHPIAQGLPLWDLTSASVRITNNTRHNISVTGAALVAVQYDQNGVRQPVNGYLDEWVIPYGYGSTPAPDGVRGFDSIEYSNDDMLFTPGSQGSSPPVAEAYALWEFSNDQLNSDCLTQQIEQR